ncbi:MULTISPECIES: alpha/beta hydrolase fold domain-containing protein [Bradyrhizobium]|uniref:alpha/beta hydrolase fold domain-containing protein n=1 Tax=Bradyrhizobium TaxID=374 RepID=UPI00286DD4B1|nr:alpha/beta hydrolase fold domain-containing protein [Bradyrhizobium centrosematis]
MAYALAPENPFPAAIDDVRAALDWCASRGDELGTDGTRIILAGTSAGANLSIAAALARRLAPRGAAARPLEHICDHIVLAQADVPDDAQRRHILVISPKHSTALCP